MRQLFLLALAGGLLVSGCAEDSNSPLGPNDHAEEAVALSAERVSAQSNRMAQDGMPMARVFRTHLDGAAEVPEVVDTRAQGQAVFRLSRDGSELSYRLLVANIDEVIGAHIHNAAEGANGPIALALFGNPFVADPGVTIDGVLVAGTATAEDVIGPFEGDLQALVEAMRMGNTYVNVHTTENRAGEIRGQIH